jgi:hypothetical protein
MSEDDVKALKRIMSLSVVKDNPEDTAYDGLHKIGKIVSELLYKYDPEWRRLQDKRQAEKQAAIDKDNAERAELWEDMT